MCPKSQKYIYGKAQKEESQNPIPLYLRNKWGKTTIKIRGGWKLREQEGGYRSLGPKSKEAKKANP